MNDNRTNTLVLGIGNVLMGDEGIGVHVIRYLQSQQLPPGVECLDGGTGSLVLLDPMQQAQQVILIDATIDGATPGTVRRLQPRYSKDYPKTLTAHDIGLKDLLDAFYLLGDTPNVILYVISISDLGEMSTELTPALAKRVPEIAQMVRQEMKALNEAGMTVSQNSPG